jgi:hypothetical protein
MVTQSAISNQQSAISNQQSAISKVSFSYFYKFLIFILRFLLIILAFTNIPIHSQTQEKSLLLKGVGEPGKRYAIVVGINDYIDTSIADLTKARDDAKGMAAMLTAKGEFDYVFTFTDDLNYRDPLFPMKANIESKIDMILARADENDMILFFFSGHGVNDKSGNGYLVAIDTKIKEPHSTAIKVEDIVEKLQKKGIKKSLLILDACREIINKESKGIENNGLREKRFEKSEVSATFYSTSSGNYSYEHESLNNGVYTTFLLKGLNGDADANKDGIVTLTELDTYVQFAVDDWAMKNHKQQKPYTKIYKEKFGDLGLSKVEKKPDLPIPEDKEPEPAKVDDKKKQQIIDKKSYSPILKSALVPGWGQYASGDKLKGTLFFSGFLLTGGLLFSKINSFEQARNSYQTNANMTLLYPSNLAILGYMNSQSLHSNYEKQAQLATTVSAIVVGIYLYNIIDIAFFGKKETASTSFLKKDGLNFNTGTQSTNYSGLERTYSINYTWSF